MERALQVSRRRKQIPGRRRKLPRRVQRVLRRTRARLRALLPNGELQSLVLYGSYVYGKPRADSDVDLLLVYDDVTPEQEKALEELTLDLYNERPRPHLFLYRADRMANNNGLDPLLYNVSHRGITLEGVPVPKVEINRKQVSAELLARAKRKLVDAQLLLNNDGYDGSIAASFYAVLYASDAALASKGHVAKSHEGTEMLFGQHFFKTKLVDDQFKGLFHRLHKARIKADYGREVIFGHEEPFGREDAEHWFERAKAFVAAIEAGVPDWVED
jgi:uncharacterized protein (UPF0332 family)/predicted nucleotidyltransferase